MAIKNSESDIYTDDGSISNEAKTLHDLNKNLTEDIAANTTKTNDMLITTRQQRATLDDQLQVVMDGYLLANVESDKPLSVMINKNLSWEEHLTKIVSTVNKKLALLRRIKNYLSTSAIFFNAHILIHLDFCGTVCGS